MRYAPAVSQLRPTASATAAQAATRPILTAELLSIGTELTVGETRDTNAGDLARALTERGVRVRRLQALPDDLDVVTEALPGSPRGGGPRRLDRRPRARRRTT